MYTTRMLSPLLEIDLRQGGYVDVDISSALDLMSVPPSDIIYDLLGRCSKCFRPGHNHPDCPVARTTRKDLVRKRWVPKEKQSATATIFCTLCLGSGHLRPKCTIGLRCKLCNLLGHFSSSCRQRFIKKGIWKIKSPSNHPVPQLRPKVCGKAGSVTLCWTQKSSRTSLKAAGLIAHNKHSTSFKELWMPKQLGFFSETANRHPPVRAGDSEMTVLALDAVGLLDWLWSLYCIRTTPRLTGSEMQSAGLFPINPMAMVRNVFWATSVAWQSIIFATPRHEEFNRLIGSGLVLDGAVITLNVTEDMCPTNSLLDTSSESVVAPSSG